MNFEKEGILQHNGTVVGEKHHALIHGLDIVEDLTVVRMDDVGERLARMHTVSGIHQTQQDARMPCLDVLQCSPSIPLS